MTITLFQALSWSGRGWLCLVLIFSCLGWWGQAGAGLSCGRQDGSHTAKEHHHT